MICVIFMNRRQFIAGASASVALPTLAIASAVSRSDSKQVLDGKVYDLISVKTQEAGGKFEGDTGFRQFSGDSCVQVLNVADARGRYTVNFPDWGGVHSGTITQLTYRSEVGGIDDYHFDFDQINKVGRPLSLRTSFAPVVEV